MFTTRQSKKRELKAAIKAGNLAEVQLIASTNPSLLGGKELYTAAENGHVDIARYLLSSHRYHEDYRQTALIISADEGKVDIMRLLLDHDIFEPRAVHFAIENGHLETMKCLIDFDVRYLDAEHHTGYLPLQTAAREDKLPAARELLENYRVDPLRTGTRADTAWQLAIEAKKNIRMLQLLLQYGADINQIFYLSHYERAIHYVLIMQKTLEIADFLAAAGADMQICDDRGNTLLHFLLKPELSVNTYDTFIAKIQFLVEYGVDHKAVNDNGQLAKSLLEIRKKITAEQFDISVEKGLATIQNNKKIIAVTLEHASNAVQLPQLPGVLPLLIADYVGGYGRALVPISTAAIDENKEYHNEEQASTASSSNYPYSRPDSDGIKASSSADQPYDQEQTTESEQSTEKPVSHNESIDTEETAEALLMRFFSWIKDLNKALQQQILSSSSMQHLLELLETSKIKKLSQAPEESFSNEYQTYYGQDDLYHTTTQAKARVNQLLAQPIDGVEIITTNGIFIDHLPKHEINFGASYILGDLASL